MMYAINVSLLLLKTSIQDRLTSLLHYYDFQKRGLTHTNSIVRGFARNVRPMTHNAMETYVSSDQWEQEQTTLQISKEFDYDMHLSFLTMLPNPIIKQARHPNKAPATTAGKIAHPSALTQFRIYCTNHRIPTHHRIPAHSHHQHSEKKKPHLKMLPP